MQQADNSDYQIKRFLQYLKAYKVPFVFAIIGMIGYSAVDTFVFSQLQPMIDESLGKNDHDYLRLAAYAIVPLFLLRGVFNFLGSYTLSWIGAQVVMRMRQQLFE
ncbi:MAG: ABC transporter transmembrane domain-containing protein, partial [Pseudomonadota bacterium]|nr:ABC transporter transmembrane domain-containing protein [Pseudomonadota bacterium]